MANTISGLAQISLYINDLQKSKKFYCDLLGFQVVHEFATRLRNYDGVKIAFLDNDDLRLELIEFPDAKQKSDGPIDHISFKVREIEKVVENLRKKGLQFETDQIFSGEYVGGHRSRWILFRGPSGERLEVTEIS